MKEKAIIFWIKYKKSILLFVCFGFLGVMMEVKDKDRHVISETDTVKRAEAGEGEHIENLTLSMPEMEEETEYSLTVPEQVLTREKSADFFDRAEKEIEESFVGENADVSHIVTDVVMKTSYVDGMVEAEWLLSDYDFINPDGTVLTEEIPKEGVVIDASVKMTCQGYERTYEFPFILCQREYSAEEKVYKALDEYFAEEGKRAGTEELPLPSEANGTALEWTEKKSHGGLLFIFLGAAAAVLVQASERSKENERQKKRKQNLMVQYPEVVNKLSLLLGAGMTMETAWERIVRTYVAEKNKTGKTKEAYEEMQVSLREIRDGVAERTAYERFGERCALRPYRKLTALIVQNLRKGNKGLTALMEAEAEEAFVMRKNLAKKLGEEAGTKLLFPMMMSLGIIIVIIMVPAVMSFYNG
jgi:hypothetical protein